MLCPKTIIMLCKEPKTCHSSYPPLALAVESLGTDEGITPALLRWGGALRKKGTMQTRIKDDTEEKQTPASTALPSDQLSDMALITAIATGAVWAMEQLFERYSPLLYALACHMVADPHVAEDLVQEAWLAVWRHAQSYHPQSGAVRSWLFSIVHHRVIDYARARHRRSPLKQVPWEEVELDERTAFPDTWDEAWRSMQSAQVRLALLKLSPQQRHAIELAYLQGWTHSEIAEACGLPLGTVKGRIRSGLLQLKREFERGGMCER